MEAFGPPLDPERRGHGVSALGPCAMVQMYALPCTKIEEPAGPASLAFLSYARFFVPFLAFFLETCGRSYCSVRSPGSTRATRSYHGRP